MQRGLHIAYTNLQIVRWSPEKRLILHALTIIKAPKAENPKCAHINEYCRAGRRAQRSEKGLRLKHIETRCHAQVLIMEVKNHSRGSKEWSSAKPYGRKPCPRE